jgi:hypothetical protein
MSPDSVVRLDAIGADLRIDVHLDVSGRREAATQAEESTPHPGQVIGGRYELVRVLGRGSMGAVWLAHDRALGEPVALKMLAPTEGTGLEGGSTTADRFRFEAQVAARLSRKTHHIVRVTDYGQEGPRAYLVMELLEGQALDAKLLQCGPMSAGAVSRLVTQIASGVETAHADGVLHRDLKPANIFLVKTGEGEPLVKLLDFGVARRSASQGLGACFATGRGLIVGTPGYMSPEQARGSSDLDGRTDLWSLAAVAYEALTGELPVGGNDLDEMFANVRAGRIVPLRERRPDLPPALDRFFERAFAPRVEDRFTTGAEFALAFDRAAGTAGVDTRGEATPPVTLRMPWRITPAPLAARGAPLAARPRHRGHVVMSLAAAALVVVVLFGSWRASAYRWRMPGGVAAANVGSMFDTAHETGGAPAPVVTLPPSAANPISAPSIPTQDEAQTISSKTRAHAPSEKTSSAAPDYGEFSTYF